MGVNVFVGVGVFVGVLVAVGVSVGVGVWVGVFVTVGVLVGVLVAVGVLVGVGNGVLVRIETAKAAALVGVALGSPTAAGADCVDPVSLAINKPTATMSVKAKATSARCGRRCRE